MEARGSVQVKSTKSNSKQHRQGKEDKRASVQKAPNHEEEVSVVLLGSAGA